MYTESIFINLISSLKDDFYNILKRPPMHPPQPFFNDFHDLKKKHLVSVLLAGGDVLRLFSDGSYP